MILSSRNSQLKPILQLFSVEEVVIAPLKLIRDIFAESGIAIDANPRRIYDAHVSLPEDIMNRPALVNSFLPILRALLLLAD